MLAWLAASLGPLTFLSALLVVIALSRVARAIRRRGAEAARLAEVDRSERRRREALAHLASPDEAARAIGASELAAIDGVEALRLLAGSLVAGSSPAVEDTFRSLAREHPDDAIAAAHGADLRAKERLARELAARAARAGARTKRAVQAYDAFWQAAATATGYPADALKSLTEEDAFPLELRRRVLSDPAHVEPLPGDFEAVAEAARALSRTADLLAGTIRAATKPGTAVPGAWLVREALVAAETDLRDADLRWAHLHEADLSGAHARGASFTGAWLDRADLSGANLRETGFLQAHAPGASFREAKLEKAKLWSLRPPAEKKEPPDFTGADWWEAVAEPPPGEPGPSAAEWLRERFPPPTEESDLPTYAVVNMQVPGGPE